MFTKMFHRLNSRIKTITLSLLHSGSASIKNPSLHMPGPHKGVVLSKPWLERHINASTGGETSLQSRTTGVWRHCKLITAESKGLLSVIRYARAVKRGDAAYLAL